MHTDILKLLDKMWYGRFFSRALTSDFSTACLATAASFKLRIGYSEKIEWFTLILQLRWGTFYRISQLKLGSFKGSPYRDIVAEISRRDIVGKWNCNGCCKSYAEHMDCDYLWQTKHCPVFLCGLSVTVTAKGLSDSTELVWIEIGLLL